MRGLLYPENNLIMTLTSIFTLPLIAPGSCRSPGKTEDQLVRLMIALVRVNIRYVISLRGSAKHKRKSWRLAWSVPAGTPFVSRLTYPIIINSRAKSKQIFSIRPEFRNFLEQNKLYL